MNDLKKDPKYTDLLKCKKVSFWLNGKEQQVVVPPGMTLLEMIHNKLNLYGTKSTCNEGDCGSCTVIVGRRAGENICYQAINSCLYPAVRIHNKHLITIEGVGTPDQLHPIQEALLDYHGTQCGYCTPGFVMALLALLINNPAPEKKDILQSLEGNLCRCTGYDAIWQAALYLSGKFEDGKSLLPEVIRATEEKIGKIADPVIDCPDENRELFNTVDYLQPQTIRELLDILNNFDDTREYGFVNGATDLLVQANVNRIYRPCLIDIAEIPELNYIRLDGDKILIGATTTLSQMARSLLISEHFPVFKKTISLIASDQIRNLATLSGNIGNASPVADTPPLLMVLDAVLELTSASGKRLLKLSDFYLDYKKTVLKAGEFISAIIIPVSGQGFYYRDMQKAAKRRAVDISTVNSSISMKITAGRLEEVRLAFGGVAVFPALAKKTMDFLEGRELDPVWFDEACQIAVSEFKPISDIRGKEDYRQVLIRNQTLTFLNCCYDLYQDTLKREER